MKIERLVYLTVILTLVVYIINRPYRVVSHHPPAKLTKPEIALKHADYLTSFIAFKKLPQNSTDFIPVTKQLLWNERYIKSHSLNVNNNYIVDPWGTPFYIEEYPSLSPNENTYYRIFSHGPNRSLDLTGGDDIKSSSELYDNSFLENALK